MRTKVDIINDSLSINAKVGTSLQEIMEFAGSRSAVKMVSAVHALSKSHRVLSF
jgi:hypothetical protein